MNELPLAEMKLAADAIRVLAMDAVQQANSGHPGTPMALADLATVLWSQFLRYDPNRPNWVDRDRVILSAGHASMLLYGVLHLTGYDLPMQEIEAFRQWGSKTPGHPEYRHTPGVETTTGPLGQGISNGVGMALAERLLAEQFNREQFPVVDHYTYVIASDGDLMEGVSHESCALAGHLGLGKLIVFWDDNKITIDGTTDLCMTENVLGRFEAYQWHTLAIDGHDLAAIAEAIEAAQAVLDRPTLIATRTHIGYGSPNKQDTSKAHGSPLGAEEIVLTRAKLGWDYPPFTIPNEIYHFMKSSADKAAESAVEWEELFTSYAITHPDLADQFVHAMEGKLPDDWRELIPTFTSEGGMATRVASGKVLDSLVPSIPTLIGGSADLTGSNNTFVKSMGVVNHAKFNGRYINYGVREHGMASMMNGMSLHGGIRPYSGTFLVFSDYMRPAMRMAALMNQPVIYVLTHDSIGLGEDGPTHQPIEHLASLRAMPNLWVVRPGDANETARAWEIALQRQDGPTALVLTRQNLPTQSAEQTQGALQGGYIFSDAENAQAVILATGSELSIAVEAQKSLAAQGLPVRVVSMPCWELFEAQSAEYRQTVLPPHLLARVAVEAASPFGWERYTGSFGKVVGLNHFGASAPANVLYEKFGITAEGVVQAVRSLVA